MFFCINQKLGKKRRLFSILCLKGKIIKKQEMCNVLRNIQPKISGRCSPPSSCIVHAAQPRRKRGAGAERHDNKEKTIRNNVDFTCYFVFCLIRFFFSFEQKMEKLIFTNIWFIQKKTTKHEQMTQRLTWLQRLQQNILEKKKINS